MDKCTFYVYKTDRLGSKEPPVYGFYDASRTFMPTVSRTLETLADVLFKKMKERCGEADPAFLEFTPPADLAERDTSETTLYLGLDREEIAIFLGHFKD